MALLRASLILGRPLSRRDPGADEADAIVVLGSPLRRNGALSPIGRERVTAGAELWKLGRGPLLCFTGGPTSGAVAEAEVMADEARALGVDAEAIRVEDRSMTTHENAIFCRALLSAEGCQRIWIVTQPFHMRRSALLFRRAGFDVLCHHIDDSIQYRNPRLAMKWIAREYLAWGVAMVRR